MKKLTKTAAIAAVAITGGFVSGVASISTYKFMKNYVDEPEALLIAAAVQTGGVLATYDAFQRIENKPTD